MLVFTEIKMKTVDNEWLNQELDLNFDKQNMKICKSELKQKDYRAEHPNSEFTRQGPSTVWHETSCLEGTLHETVQRSWNIEWRMVGQTLNKKSAKSSLRSAQELFQTIHGGCVTTPFALQLSYGKLSGIHQIVDELEKQMYIVSFTLWGWFRAAVLIFPLMVKQLLPGVGCIYQTTSIYNQINQLLHRKWNWWPWFPTSSLQPTPRILCMICYITSPSGRWERAKSD